MTVLRILFFTIVLSTSGSVLLVPLSTGAPLLSNTLLPDHAPADPPTLIKHLRTELRSSDASRREAALIDVIVLANCRVECSLTLRSAQDRRIQIADETGVGSVFDLRALAPVLLDAYRSEPADGHRLLALSALINVGDENVLEKLIEEKEGQSAAVKRATDRSLVGFYLSKYPELAEKTVRTKTLSIEDVKRAEVTRLRIARGPEN